LDEAEEAADAGDWEAVRARAEAVLIADPDNADAPVLLGMANKMASQVDAGVESSQDSPPPPAATSAEGPSDNAPTSFANDRYRVSKFLGEGGKKRVYLAHDTLLDREVAFALIKTEGFDQTSKERVSREAQAMGRLGVHPNIVAVLDLGQEDDGSPYMVTELMGGGDVEALLASRTTSEPPPSQGGGEKDLSPFEGEDLSVGETSSTGTDPSVASRHGGLSLERTIEIGKAVCEGLEFAHARGIVHRDLKPGNVWLTADGTAKIGDFGLAMLTDRSRLTREAMMIGTVSYMPPEQATGGEITARADLYSLGAMLYEMVTGRPPFLGDDDIAIIGQHINTPPVAPTWHNGNCPRPLEALVMRMLAKDPAERLESAQDVFNALDAIDLTARGETVERDANSLESLAGGVFVGRQVEMDQLKAALEDVLGGKGRLITLLGEPGIGKTRTSEELATYAGLRGVQVLWGRCYETGGQPPYWPWVQAIRSYVREIDPDELRRQMGSSASVMAEIITDVKDRLPELQPPPVLEDPDSARFRLFDSIASFLKAASQTRPLAIVLDDLHWSDRPSLTFLEFMAREIGQFRLLIVGTYRDMELNRRHPLTVTLGDLARERLYERVLLRGLSKADIARFIEIAAGANPPPELAEAVYRHTEGNPLFVTEVVRELVQSGEIAGTRTSGASTWSVRIPEGVREVIGRRLDRLSERANDVLTTAAVVGRDFRLDTLKELAEDTTEGQLLDVLDESLDAKIIEELPDGIGHYQFTHALMQETLSGELSLTRRVRLHARIAETLERLYGDDADEHAPELAYHFGAAEAVLGTDQLLRYSIIAGESALDRLGFDDALEYFERARSAIVSAPDGTHEGEVLAKVYSGLGAARAPRGSANDRQIAWRDLTQAFDIYVSQGDIPNAVRMVTNPMVLGGVLEATEVLRNALELVTEESIEAGWIWSRYGTSLMDNVGDFDAANSAYRRAKSIGESHGQLALRARAHAHLCQLADHSLDSEGALEHGAQAWVLADEGDDPSSATRSAVYWANALAKTGDLERSTEVLEANLELSRRLGQQSWRGGSALRLIVQTLARGDWDAVARFRQDLVPIPTVSAEVYLLLDEVIRAITAGGPDDADAISDRMRSEIRDAGRLSMVANIVALKFAEITDDADLYRFLTGSASDLVENADYYLDFAHMGRVIWAVAAARIGDARSCSSLYQELSDQNCRFDNQTGFSGDRVLGLISAAAGDSPRSAQHFDAALDWCRPAGLHAELAWTCSDYAEMLLDRDEPGDREKAIELQDEALTITQELGMRPLTERILARREILRA